MTTDNRLTQTEGTNCAMVENTLSGGIPSAGWNNLEINSYSKLGSSFKKVPRDPISQSLQMRKSMLTDEDSGASLEMDVTKHHMDQLAKFIFRSVPKHNGNKQQSYYQVASVDGTGVNVAALGDIAQHFMVYLRGLDNDTNQGLFVVGAGSTGTHTNLSGVTSESVISGQNATMELIGYRATSGDLYFDSDGNLNSHGATDFTTWNLQDFQWIYFGSDDEADHAFATPEFRGNCRVGKSGVTTNKIVLDRHAWEVGSHAELDLGSVTTNLDSVLEAVVAGASGDSVTLTLTGDGSPGVKAYKALNAGGLSAHIDTVVQAKAAGAAGNLITIEVVAGAPTAAGVLTEVGTHVKIAIKTTATASTVADVESLIATSTLIEVKTPGTGATSLDGTDVFGSAALASGVDPDAVSYSESGSDATMHYTPAVSTVEDIEASITANSTIISVLIEGTPTNVAQSGDAFSSTAFAGGTSGADAGTSKTIDVYFGRHFRNVARNHDDFAKPTATMEISFEELAADGGTEYWYLMRNSLDETVINIPLTNKATLNTTWVGTKTPNPVDSGSRKAGAAAAYDGNANDGVSTSVDIARIRVDQIDDTGVSTDFESLKLTVKNNVSMQKQIGSLGGVKTIHGQCMVSAEVTAIFTSDQVIRATRANTTCHLDVLIQNAEFGAVLDIHAMTLDTSDPKLEKNKAVTIDVKSGAFESDETGATLGMTIFPYLPQRSTDDLD